MARNQLDRESETRETKTRKKSWVRPEALPQPTPREGYTHRWIRVSTMGNSDAKNISSKLREGWEPVLAKDYPEIYGDDIREGRFTENVMIGGLLLCKAPDEMVDERNEFYQNQTRHQIEAVDNNLMRESDARMPLFNERKSKTTFGRGS